MPREARTLDQANYAEMLVEKRDDGVALITLNRPERHNASTAVMHAEFAQLPGDIQADADVKAAVITGAGRSFCSGADVQQRLGGGGEGMSALDVLGEPREIVEGFLNNDKPVITAVKGYALGFGCTTALLGDIVIAGRSAVFADPHVTVGLTAGDGGALLWPLLAGPQQAKYYLMTGERLDAETAERIGLEAGGGSALRRALDEALDQPRAARDSQRRDALLAGRRGHVDDDRRPQGGRRRLHGEAPAPLHQQLACRAGSGRPSPQPSPSGRGGRTR